MNIYFDNASTSYPKPKAVADAVYDYMSNIGTNVNRGSYDAAYTAEELIYDTRCMINRLFNGHNCKNVIFTSGVTESINIVLKGFLRPGDHVLVSSLEHNAVMRPLTQLAKYNISYSRIPCNNEGDLELSAIPGLIKSNTRAMILTHASNVCGTVLPIAEAGRLCSQYNIKLFVDCAQTAGVLPIDMQTMNIDALMFTGHKGLLGPQGIGGLVLTDEIATATEPLITGGTGSISHTEDIPTFMPDKFESGTLNIPGIYGLHAALEWIEETGMDKIYAHEMLLTRKFIDGINEINSELILGHKDMQNRIGVVGLDISKSGTDIKSAPELDCAKVSYILDSEYHIMTRAGMHCAPNAHKALGAYPAGSLRFSFGWYNTEKEIENSLAALNSIIHKR